MHASVALDALKQLVAQCREQPLVFDHVRPELCAPLTSVILGRMQSSAGRKTASLNVGGWKSGEDFFSWLDEPVQELRRAIGDLIGTRSLVAWAMVNRAGSRHPRHQHRVAVLTGVYYVAAGSADAITPTIFECPCDGRPKLYDLEIDPHPGRLAVFRGETWHHVPAYPGDLPRITVAFDVRR